MNRELKEIMKIMARMGFDPKTRSKTYLLYHVPLIRKTTEGEVVVAFGSDDETGPTQIVVGGIIIPKSKINNINHIMADFNASQMFGYLVLSEGSVLFRHTMTGHENLDVIFERVLHEFNRAFEYISEALSRPAINIHVTAGHA